MEFQAFLAKYCFFDQAYNDKLFNDPRYILQHAVYADCPQQNNDYDCGLFATAVVLHISHGVPIVEDVFTQEHITNCRCGLFTQLSKSTGPTGPTLTPHFVPSFFPQLSSSSEVTASPAQSHTDNSSRNNTGVDTGATLSTNNPTVEGGETRSFDKHFNDIFIVNKPTYFNHDEIYRDVQKYEDSSGLHIAIRRCKGDGKTFFCASHIGCSFRAKFGRIRGTDKLCLKEENSCAFHCGVAADGRAHKTRVKDRVYPLVAHVALVKDKPVEPKDDVKAVANVNKCTATYHQSFRAVQASRSDASDKNKRSFQLLIPHLQKFMELNKGSKAMTECDGENHIRKVFICPAIMSESLRFVRPVLSLDAAHLKSCWKGSLYIASVKTGCDNIYQVAIAILDEYENISGWKWFLEHLRSSLPMLTLDHPKHRVQKKLFTFISDRQKGLVQALKEVFPDNHATFCAIHIARNVERSMGKKDSKYVVHLARTFSPMLFQVLMTELTAAARQYLEAIPASQWINTAWLEDSTLPPRYGVRTSNMSESSNSMFEEARDERWLYSVDTILSKTVERISDLRKKHKGKTGVVETVASKNDNLFNIVHPRRKASDTGMRYNIDVAQKCCNCDEWQDHGVPCIHAIAYFRFHKQVILEQILQEEVDQYYKYENERMLLRNNIQPICMEWICHDGRTLPPRESKKRSTGRRRKKRSRKRSRWSYEPEKSKIVCSRCHQRGHNIRTCIMREELARQGTDTNSIVELDLS
jgi:MULE transposase domain/Ulp1 protease family, C-terminal catalytic domain/SWIM zinc finger